MFHLSERLSTKGASRPQARRYLKRAALFAGGLLLLWISMQLLPGSPERGVPPVYSDDAGTVATRAETEPIPDRSIITTGNAVAVLLLGGGIVLAVYLRRRTTHGDEPSTITPLGEYAIGPNQSLRLIECGGEVLLVGVTSGQISLLRSFPPDRFEEPDREAVATQSAGHSHFGDVLRRYAGQHAQIEMNGSTC